MNPDNLVTESMLSASKRNLDVGRKNNIKSWVSSTAPNMFHSTRRQRASQCQLSVYILTLHPVMERDHGNRPWVAAAAASHLGVHRWEKQSMAWRGPGSTECAQTSTEYAQGQPATRPKPGCEQNPKMDIAADVTVTLFAFLVSICMWSCWLETLQYIQKGYHTHISLPWDAGNVGAMALDHWPPSEMASGAGILTHLLSQPTKVVAPFLYNSSCSHPVHLLVIQLCSFP